MVIPESLFEAVNKIPDTNLICPPIVSQRAALAAIFRLWRPSLLAGAAGALASQMWFLAFSLQTAAAVNMGNSGGALVNMNG